MPVSPGGILRRLALPACLLVAPGLSAAPAPSGAPDERPSDEAIRALQERGRMIALYLQAVDRAADLLKAQGSNAPPSDRTVVIPSREGWRVHYLQDPAKGTAAPAGTRKGLAIVAETTFSPDSGETGALGLIVPPRIASSSIQSFARALDEAGAATLARPDSGRPFLDAVIREEDNTFSVYVVSQRPEEGASPGGVVVGREFLVRVAASGRQMLAVEKLHDRVATLSLQPRAPGAPTLHEHGPGDLPSPTDVALALRHPVLAPLLVLTPRFMFRIDQKGGVTWLGPNPAPRPAASPSPGNG